MTGDKNLTRTTSMGGTVTLVQVDHLLVMLDHPDAPPSLRNVEAGRVIEGAFQPASFFPAAMRPEVLRLIADLIEEVAQ